MAIRNDTLTLAVFRDQGFPPVGNGDEGVRVLEATAVDDFSRAIADADVVFFASFRAPLLRQAWPTQHHVRWLQVAAVGVDAVLFPELVSSDVVLTNTRGVLDGPMAEYTMALLLALAKDLRTTFELQRERTWKFREPAMLRGRTVVVVGVGGIGSAIAKSAVGMGMTVIGVGRTARPPRPPFERIVAATDLPRLLPQAEYVVLALPLTAETRGLFSRSLIEAMRPSAYLVNVGRGKVLDEGALIEALEGKRIAGAALDVFQTEPLPKDNPLWGMPNVIVSPHMSADVPESAEWIVELFRTNLERYRRGERLLNVVDKQLGFVASTS